MMSDTHSQHSDTAETMAVPVDEANREVATTDFLDYNERMIRFLESGEHSDTTITCGDQIFHAHKVVLFSRCAFFEKAFAGDYKESVINGIVLSDDDPTAIKAMLHHIYVGRLPLPTPSKPFPPTLYLHLLILADKYDLPLLTAQTERTLERLLPQFFTDKLFTDVRPKHPMRGEVFPPWWKDQAEESELSEAIALLFCEQYYNAAPLEHVRDSLLKTMFRYADLLYDPEHELNALVVENPIFDAMLKNLAMDCWNGLKMATCEGTRCTAGTHYAVLLHACADCGGPAKPERTRAEIGFAEP